MSAFGGKADMTFWHELRAAAGRRAKLAPCNMSVFCWLSCARLGQAGITLARYTSSVQTVIVKTISCAYSRAFQCDMVPSNPWSACLLIYFDSHIYSVTAVTRFAIHAVIGITKIANNRKAAFEGVVPRLHGSTDMSTRAGRNYWGPPKEECWATPEVLAGNGEILVCGKGSVHIKRRK